MASDVELRMHNFRMVEWIRILLPMQGTQVWSLAREGSTRHRVTKACGPQQGKSHSEKPVHRSKEQPLLTAPRESPGTLMKSQHHQKYK